MAAQLVTMPFLHALDNTGAPVASARLYVYDTGGTTNHDAFTTDALSTEHDQPIVADAAGRFPQIFLDSADGEARVVLKDADGTTLADIDPVNPAASLIVNADITNATIAGTKFAAGAVVAHLGYTPLDAAGSQTASGLKLSTTAPAAMDGTEAGWRSPVPRTVDASETLVLNDAGKALLHTSGSAHTWTIPPEASVAWPSGAMIELDNIGAGSVTIARGAGVVLRLQNSATDGDKTMAQWGGGRLFKRGTNSWVIRGSAGIT